MTAAHVRSPDETIFFMHIPKTAGSSVHRIFELNVPPWRTYSLAYPAARAQAEFQRLPRTTRNAFRVVKGHFPYGFHRHLDNRPRYVTFVRHPLARVLSDYNYRCTVPFLPHFDEFRASGFSFEFYFDRLYIPSLSTLFFAGIGHLQPADVPMSVVFERAREHLERFDYVGRCEDFERSVEQMAAACGLRHVADVRTNVTSVRRRSEFTYDERERVIDAEQWDLRLYELILQREARRDSPAGCVRRLSGPVATAMHYRGRILQKVHGAWFRQRHRKELAAA